MRAPSIAGRVAYGATFAILLPAGLVWWARAAEPLVPLPVVHATGVGVAIAVGGLLLIASGMRELVVRGGGLPMNAFPPPRFVRSGVYRWLRNPIYIGFGLVCAGAAMASGSRAGLWLVMPSVALASAALVYGYERQDLTRRFGEDARRRVLLSLPPESVERPTAADRVAVVVWILIPWLIAFYAVQALGVPPDAFHTTLPFERDWPVLQWTELFYASAYVFIPITVPLIRTRRDLRRFAIQAGLAIPIFTLVWLTVPVVATNRPFEPANMWGRLLALEQAHSNRVAAFPAFHVLWAMIAAEARRTRLWRTWAAFIIASCLTTGMHTVIEVAAALALFPVLSHYDRIWSWIRGLTERAANSWKEWRVGPVRVINHGVWAAAAAGIGLMVAGSAAPPDRTDAVVWVGVCVLVGAAIWAQLLEGSSRLLRPFGWYGGIVGGVFGALTARLAGVPILPILAAFAIAAPWIQILGRVRCLAQGCCHGGPAPAEIGIRYRHPRSRVAHLADLANVPIHATPLYSIVSNLVIGVALLRLRALGTPDSLLIGIYLILAGIARFVEESFRAEPQTPIVAGLHSYQWIAVASLLIGIVCTTIRTAPATIGFALPDARLVWASLTMAIVTGIAMGVDFPRSNRRFSRLAPAD